MLLFIYFFSAIFQSNGLTERLNQTLSRSLSKLVNKDHTDWDRKLDTVLFAYRVSKQKSTGFSPFYMMFHRKPSLPSDFKLLSSTGDGETGNDEQDFEEFIDNMLDVVESIKETATKNIAKAQTKQKEYFDKRHSTEVNMICMQCGILLLFLNLQELKPGTKVLVENTYQKQRKGGKWEDLYKGPYVIHNSLGKGVYTLKKMDGTVLKSKHNINRLKVTLPHRKHTMKLFLLQVYVECKSS